MEPPRQPPWNLTGQKADIITEETNMAGNRCNALVIFGATGDLAKLETFSPGDRRPRRSFCAPDRRGDVRAATGQTPMIWKRSLEDADRPGDHAPPWTSI